MRTLLYPIALAASALFFAGCGSTDPADEPGALPAHVNASVTGPNPAARIAHETAADSRPVDDGTTGAPADTWWTVARHLGEPGGDEATRMRQGIDKLDAYIQSARALRRKAEVDPIVWQVLRRSMETVEERSLVGLYEMLPVDAAPDGTKRLRFVGRQVEGEQGTHYRVGLVGFGDTPADGAARVGEYESTAALRPVHTDEDPHPIYAVQMAFWLNSGQLVPAQVASLIAENLRWFERAAAREAPGRPEGPLRREDRAVLQALARSMPRAFPYATDLIRVRDVAWIDYRRGTPVTQVQLVLEPNMTALAERFPKIHAYLSQSKTMRSTRLRLLDASDRELLRLDYDGPNLQMRARYAHRHGKLLPLLGSTIDPGLDLERRGEQRATVVVDTRLEYYGITIRIEDWRIPLTYRLDERRMTGEYHVCNLPGVIAVEGRLMHVLPVWMLEALMPAKLETMLRGFLERLIKGDRGNGLRMVVGFERDPIGATDAASGTSEPPMPRGWTPTRWGTRFIGELADNGFVRVHHKMIRDRVAPRRRARSEIGQLYTELVERLREDMAAFRASVR